MANFRTVQIRPMTGTFDSLSSPDEVGYGNWRVVKNAVTRSTRNRQRAGGWRRLFAEDAIYNNQDLHDQLTDRLGYYDSYSATAMSPSVGVGYSYPYFAPPYELGGGTVFPPASGPFGPVYLGDHPDGTFNGCPIFYPFSGVPYSYIYGGYSGHLELTTGYPGYYLQSYVYTSCPVAIDATDYPGYPYGPGTQLFSPAFSYSYTYCGRNLHLRPGCREAVTLLEEITIASGRKLVAATMSRVYELDQSSGAWRILADGLGNSGYTLDQCTCNSVRGVTDTLGGYLFFTNNFDPPMSYFEGDAQSDCALQALSPVTDLVALGITQAGGVVVWKGFVIWFDITENSERQGGTVVWGDLDSPSSFIESDTSFAGRATIAVGATILAAAPLGNALMFYTDRGIIRCTLVGGEDVFNFETIYEGGNSMKFKFSLVNAGDQHLYAGESDIYVLTQFDSRPINLPWVTKAAGMMFFGSAEDHSTYEPLNRDACNMVTGGWNEETKEAYMSYPSGDNICPDVTLRFNLKFNAADFIDHGFTSFLTFRRDDRPTIGQWAEDLGICPRGTLVQGGFKDGEVCMGGQSEVANPPLYLINPTEDPDLPAHPRSVCALLGNKTLADFCNDCAAETTFIAASADDFALKQIEDDIGYREQLGGSAAAYDGYACHGEFYTHYGYQTVMQQGAENYRSDDEKMVKMVGLEAEPVAQTTPSILTMQVGYAAQPNCFTWVDTKDVDYECLTAFSAAQHTTNRTRPDGTFYFPTWRRGRYLSTRFIIEGLGGLGTFSALVLMVRVWGQQENP